MAHKKWQYEKALPPLAARTCHLVAKSEPKVHGLPVQEMLLHPEVADWEAGIPLAGVTSSSHPPLLLVEVVE